MANPEQSGGWLSLGTDVVMLPSGAEVQIDLPSVAEMLYDGSLPGALRSVALRFASSDGIEPDALRGEEQIKWASFEQLLVARSLVGLRLPERTGPPERACRAGGVRHWHADGEIVPFHATPEELGDEQRIMPRLDLSTLKTIVLRIRSARAVDALSRVAHGLMEPDEAARIEREEQANTIAAWTSFRGQPRGTAAGAERKGVGRATVGAGRGQRAARRAAPRRRAGDQVPAGTRRKRTQHSAS